MRRNRPPAILDLSNRQAWATPTAPSLDKPRLIVSAKNPPIGGPQVSPNAMQTYDLRFAAVLGGTKIFLVDALSVLTIQDATPAFRNFLWLRNSSATAVDIYVNFGDNANTASMLILAQNEQAFWDAAVPQDDIYAICPATGGQLSIGVGLFSIPQET